MSVTVVNGVGGTLLVFSFCVSKKPSLVFERLNVSIRMALRMWLSETCLFECASTLTYSLMWAPHTFHSTQLSSLWKVLFHYCLLSAIMSELPHHVLMFLFNMTHCPPHKGAHCHPDCLKQC